MDDQTNRRVQSEFTRQARQMASAPAFQVPAVMQRFLQAVGDAPDDRLLDVACGPGILAEALAPHVGTVTGIDTTPEMVRLAGERFEKAALRNGRFELAPAEHLPFGDASFEQAITRLSFHHFQDIPAVLKEIRRVLRPGGRFAAADIICVEDPGRAALHNSVEQLRDPTHVRFLSGTELAGLIDAAGFSTVRQDMWEQQRSFDEWAGIIADPARMQPLEQVMRALARAGEDCGMSLREESGKLVFLHRWLMVVADSSTGAKHADESA